ncbi:hypothetical protein, partial [Kribbella solani]
MIGGFVVEGALIGAAGCAVWEVAVRARRWVRSTRRLSRLARYLEHTSHSLREVALSIWKSTDPSMRRVAHAMLDLTAEFETAAARCHTRTWRPQRAHRHHLNNLMTAAQVLRRTAHSPQLDRTTDGAALHLIADSLRRTTTLGFAIEPPTRGPATPL